MIDLTAMQAYLKRLLGNEAVAGYLHEFNEPVYDKFKEIAELDFFRLRSLEWTYKFLKEMPGVTTNSPRVDCIRLTIGKRFPHIKNKPRSPCSYSPVSLHNLQTDRLRCNNPKLPGIPKQKFNGIIAAYYWITPEQRVAHLASYSVIALREEALSSA